MSVRSRGNVTDTSRGSPVEIPPPNVVMQAPHSPLAVRSTRPPRASIDSTCNSQLPSSSVRSSRMGVPVAPQVTVDPAPESRTSMGVEHPTTVSSRETTLESEHGSTEPAASAPISWAREHAASTTARMTERATVSMRSPPTTNAPMASPRSPSSEASMSRPPRLDKADVTQVCRRPHGRSPPSEVSFAEGRLCKLSAGRARGLGPRPATLRPRAPPRRWRRSRARPRSPRRRPG